MKAWMKKAKNTPVKTAFIASGAAMIVAVSVARPAAFASSQSASRFNFMKD